MNTLTDILNKYISIIQNIWDEGSIEGDFYGFICKFWAFIIVDMTLFIPAIIITFFNSEILLTVWMLAAVPAFVLWLIIRKRF